MTTFRRKLYHIGLVGMGAVLVLLAGLGLGARAADGAPLVSYMPALARCGVTLPPPPPSPVAFVQITPNQPVNASTYNAGSFIVRNDSAESFASATINQVRIDLSTALLPDIVFDPNGGAGDQVAKDVTVDFTSGGVALAGRSYDGPRDGGFDVLILDFSGFVAGAELRFSVDVDPTSIKGGSSPGPGDSGSVSGLEMAGATVTVVFGLEGGGTATHAATTVPELPPGFASESRAVVRAGLPPTPTLAPVGVSAPAVVTDPALAVDVTSARELPVTVYVFDANLFTDGLPGGGFDLDPFEANSVVGLAGTYGGVTGCADGRARVVVTLTDAPPQERYNYIAAVVTDPLTGLSSALSNVVVFDYAP